MSFDVNAIYDKPLSFLIGSGASFGAAAHPCPERHIGRRHGTHHRNFGDVLRAAG